MSDTTSANVPSAPPRVHIERVGPSVDGGRYPAKRVTGDTVFVEAIVYRDGHALVTGRVRYRGPGERRWRTTPMGYTRDVDRCTGAFVVDRVGRWVFTVDAWTDRYRTWAQDLRKFLDAQQDVHAELLEGAELFERAAEAARGEARTALAAVAAELLAADRPQGSRAAAALHEHAATLMAQYLPPDDLTRHAVQYPVDVEPPVAAFGAWYEMFPRSQATEPGRHGTFDDAAVTLSRIADLGFDVVYLPPIHPIGRTHRKGPNNRLTAGPDDPGSPWAIGNETGGHTAVEPALGTLQDFERFVARATELGLRVALDYALQCSPDHPWVDQHPHWFFVRADGSIRYAENPPKKYEDILPLNFWCRDYEALWRACRDVLVFWIERGVRVFRVDNPHTKPFAFWEWLIRDIKPTYPDVIFLSEAFTRPARMHGLAKLGFSQSYTYFTWRNSAWELRDYLSELTRTETVQYFRPNFFTNTPDILHAYLQDGGRAAFRIRLLLAATLAPVYGVYSGFELCENLARAPGSEEYLDSEKYQIRQRDWHAPGNINEDIVRLNTLRRSHPALQQLGNLTFHPSRNDQILFYLKQAPEDDLLIAVNLDPHHPQETMVQVPVERLGLPEDQPFAVEDLLTGDRYTWQGRWNYVRLDPQEQVAHILRLLDEETGV